MTESEYKEKLTIVEQSYKAELHKLYSQFAAGNSFKRLLYEAGL